MSVATAIGRPCTDLISSETKTGLKEIAIRFNVHWANTLPPGERPTAACLPTNRTLLEITYPGWTDPDHLHKTSALEYLGWLEMGNSGTYTKFRTPYVAPRHTTTPKALLTENQKMRQALEQIRAIGYRAAGKADAARDRMTTIAGEALL